MPPYLTYGTASRTFTGYKPHDSLLDFLYCGKNFHRLQNSHHLARLTVLRANPSSVTNLLPPGQTFFIDSKTFTGYKLYDVLYCGQNLHMLQTSWHLARRPVLWAETRSVTNLMTPWQTSCTDSRTFTVYKPQHLARRHGVWGTTFIGYEPLDTLPDLLYTGQNRYLVQSLRHHSRQTVQGQKSHRLTTSRSLPDLLYWR